MRAWRMFQFSIGDAELAEVAKSHLLGRVYSFNSLLEMLGLMEF